MSGKLRTEPIKGLVIFLAIVIPVSIAALIITIIDRSNWTISILTYIFGGLFVVLGTIILIDQLFHYTELKEDVLIDHVVFKKRSLPISKIKKIVLQKGIYEIYYKKGLFCSLPSQLKGVNYIMVALQRHGLEVEEK